VAQLIRVFPGGRFLPIRGNLDTRLRKLDSGEFDAIVLAAAGLRRLQQGGRISATLPIAACVPAPGQGIIAIEIRSDAARVREVLTTINDGEAALALEAERSVVRALGGGCQMPIGAHAAIAGMAMQMTGVVISLDGARAVRADVAGAAGDADELGSMLGERLLQEGASEILAEVQRAQAAVEGLQP
jgi:hydroxymethylbilane synthase